MRDRGAGLDLGRVAIDLLDRDGGSDPTVLPRLDHLADAQRPGRRAELVLMGRAVGLLDRDPVAVREGGRRPHLVLLPRRYACRVHSSRGSLSVLPIALAMRVVLL